MLVMAHWDKEMLILLLSGRFDKTARVPVETALAEIESRSCKHVVFDFSKVSSLDSAGIGKLLLLYYALRKKNVATPVLVLTVRATLEDKVLGLEIGADDYVVKPFSPRELTARVKAVGCQPQPSSPGKTLSYLMLERGSAIISATVSRQVW